jgi:hypothetical protein
MANYWKVRAEMEAQDSIRNRSSVMGSSPDRPVPIGVPTKVTIERGYFVEIKVLEIVRGKDAWERVREEGIADDQLKTGFEYLLARISFGYSRKAKGFEEPNNVYGISAKGFSSTSGDGKTEFEIPSVLRQPQPQLIDIPIPLGTSREGWIILQVPEDEKEPLLAFHREHAHSNYVLLPQWSPVWFKLHGFDPMCINSSCQDCR